MCNGLIPGLGKWIGNEKHALKSGGLFICTYYACTLDSCDAWLIGGIYKCVDCFQYIFFMKLHALNPTYLYATETYFRSNPHTCSGTNVPKSPVWRFSAAVWALSRTAGQCLVTPYGMRSLQCEPLAGLHWYRRTESIITEGSNPLDAV